MMFSIFLVVQRCEHRGSSQAQAVTDSKLAMNSDLEAYPLASKDAAIDPDPRQVLCPPRFGCQLVMKLEIPAYISEAGIVLGNLINFIHVLSTEPEVWLQSLPPLSSGLLMSSTTSIAIFLVHKLAGRFRLEGLRSDDQVPAWYKTLPAVLFSHEPLTTPFLVVFVPILYVFLGLCILAGMWTSTLVPGLFATLGNLITVLAFALVSVFELHHLTVEEKRVQPAACWAFSTFLLVWATTIPMVSWWVAARFECDHLC